MVSTPDVNSGMPPTYHQVDRDPQLVENSRYSNDAVIKKTQSFQKMMMDMSN